MVGAAFYNTVQLRNRHLVKDGERHN